MKGIFGLLFAAAAVWGESFISQEEYARMLYQNPRGIGCHKCHGEDGRGMELGRFRDGNVTKVIFAPDITRIDYERFREALRTKRRSLMPSYFLTDYEIKTLYRYLHEDER